VLTSELARQKVITPEAHTRAALLYAFGSLIGNTDMHAGNLSFVGDHGQPYALSPAYDMLPMAFAPTSGGSVRDTLLAAYLHPAVGGDIWGKARELAMEYLTRLSQDTRFGDSFQPCISAIRGHVDETSKKIRKLE
jgi:hypothetical protein